MLPTDILRALWQATVPVGIVSYLLVWWALKHDYFGPVTSIKEMHQRTKQRSRDNKIQRKRRKNQRKGRKNKSLSTVQQHPDPGPANPLNPVHKKWLKFGGGFYGVVALITYGVIEWADIRSLFARFDGFLAMLAGINANLFVNIIVNSITNFVVAISWPIYWLDAIRGGQPLIWLLAAYLGYWLGCRMALRRHAGSQNRGSE